MGQPVATRSSRPAPARTLDRHQFCVVLDGLRRRHGWPEDSQRHMEGAVLGYHPRTVRRWIAGERPVPPAVARLLLALERDPALAGVLLRYQAEGWPKLKAARQKEIA